MDKSNKETTAATVVSKESLQGKRNSTIACELYQLIDDRDFDSVQEISKTIYAIAINRKVSSKGETTVSEASLISQDHQDSQALSDAQCTQPQSHTDKLSCKETLQLHATQESVLAESQTRAQSLLSSKDNS